MQDYSVEPFVNKLDSLNHGSIFQESLENVIGKSHKHQNKHLETLEDQFNRLLSEYTKTVRLIAIQTVEKNEKKNIGKSLYGKVVNFKNGQKAYINKYGYGHKFSPDAWEKRDKSCNSIEECQGVGCDLVFNSIPLKEDMIPGQPCGIEGSNIQNTSSKEYAWVDIYGVKHVYPDDVYKDKEKTCNKTPVLLSSNAYNSIPSGNKMTLNTPCLNMDVDVNLFIRLNKINHELLQIATDMNDELNKIQVNDKTHLLNEYKKRGKILGDNIKKLKMDRERINNSSYQSFALVDDTRLSMNTYYYNYLVWSLVALTVSVFAIKHILK